MDLEAPFTERSLSRSVWRFIHRTARGQKLKRRSYVFISVYPDSFNDSYILRWRGLQCFAMGGESCFGGNNNYNAVGFVMIFRSVTQKNQSSFRQTTFRVKMFNTL